MSQSNTLQLVHFLIEEQGYAVHLQNVQRILNAIAVTPLPEAPDSILGIIDIEGDIVPVFNLRRRFGIRIRDVVPSDHFIIAATSRRTVALVVDVVVGLLDVRDDQIVASRTIVPGTASIEGVVASEDGIVFIQDLERFLSLEEEAQLDQSLTR